VTKLQCVHQATEKLYCTTDKRKTETASTLSHVHYAITFHL